MAAITAFEASLRAHITAFEQAFMATGAALNEQTGLTAALVDVGSRFADFTSDDAARNPVRRGIGLVDATLRRLHDLQGESDAVIGGLRALHADICRLQQHGAMLDRAIAPLRIVDTLFRIEASTLPAETQAAFGALTQEIAQLDGRVRQTFSRHFEALEITRAATDDVMRHLEAQRTQHERVAAEQCAIMQQTLAALDSSIARLRRRDERTTAAVRAIDRDTNGIVVALQFQDITRQKLEHVSVALATLRERVAAGTADVAYVGHAARLQARQLAAVDADIAGAIAQVHAGLEQIVLRLREVESGCLDSGSSVYVVSEAGTIMDTLQAMLPTLGAAIDESAVSGRAAARAVQSFGAVASDLGATVRELTWGIRLIALNAQVQAAQVKRCDGLEVLARHTYIVSDETARLAERLGAELGTLNTQLRDAVTGAQGFAQHTAAAQQDFAAASRTLGADFEVQRQAVAAAVDAFAPLLRRTREHAGRLLDHAALARIEDSGVTTLQVKLEELAHWCGEQRGAKMPDPALRQAFAALEQQYTMESERAVHDAVLNVGPRTAPRGSAVSGSFFDEATSDAAPLPPPARDFPFVPGSSAPNRIPSAPATPLSAGLGDNVELF